MKRLLQICLLINVVLLSLIWWHHHQRHEQAMVRTLRTLMVDTNQGAINRRSTEPSAHSALAIPWQSLESKDRKQFLANLRAVGCPEQTIRDLIALRIGREYHRKLLDWGSADQLSRDGRQLTSRQHWQEQNWQRNELGNAMQSELESLLGINTDQLWTTVCGFRVAAFDRDYLPLEKQGRLRELQQRYDRYAGEVRQGLLPEECDAAMNARIQELNRQKEAELKQLLSPEELEAFNLRESPAARYVGAHLPAASSEAEFKRMVQAVESVGIPEANPPNPLQRFGLVDPSDTSDEDRKQAEKQAQLAARLQEVLGSQRVAEQQQEEQTRADQQRQEEEERNLRRDRAETLQAANEIGIDEAQAIQFLDRLKEQTPALEKKFEEMAKTMDGSQQKADAFKAAIQAEFDKLATEIIGEKGPELVKKIMKDH